MSNDDSTLREIKREIDAALHPKGMSTHDGFGRFQAHHIQRLLDRLAAAERDAARYRWIEANPWRAMDLFKDKVPTKHWIHPMREAIDRAMGVK